MRYCEPSGSVYVVPSDAGHVGRGCTLDDDELELDELELDELEDVGADVIVDDELDDEDVSEVVDETSELVSEEA